MPVDLRPPVISVPAAPPIRSTDLVTFAPEAVMCDGHEVDRTGIVRPFPATTTRYPDTAPADPPTYRFTFAIDADGRPRTIRKDEQVARYYVDTTDLAPSLAVSRFPAGAPRTACSIAYRATSSPVATAPLAALFERASLPGFYGPAEDVIARLRPAGADCVNGPGAYRQLNQPAFETIPQAPGTWSWAQYAFDVDPLGRPTVVRVLASSGSAALDRAGARALAANRFAPGPGVRGCLYHFYRVAAPSGPAPTLPAGTPADTGETPGCAIDPESIAPLLRGTAYPAAFQRRRIEGVAALRYDTAPWGAIGNIRVVASEPDEAFADTARAALSAARVAETATGRRDCISRFRFRLPPEPPVAAE